MQLNPAIKPPATTAAERKEREARRLSTLLEVSQALGGTLDLKSAKPSIPKNRCPARCAAW